MYEEQKGLGKWATAAVPAGLAHSLLLLVAELKHSCNGVEHVSFAACITANQITQHNILQVL